MPTQNKIETVKKLTEKLAKAKALVITDYRGLKHKQLEELRRNLKKVDGEFMIAKNRLFLRALGDRGEMIKSSLEDASAVLFAYADEVAPIKALLAFFKTAAVGKAKQGLLGTQVLSDTDITRLAKLPTRNVLLGQLVAQLNAPIQGLHRSLQWNFNKLVWVLNSIKNSKSS